MQPRPPNFGSLQDPTAVFVKVEDPMAQHFVLGEQIAGEQMRRVYVARKNPITGNFVADPTIWIFIPNLRQQIVVVGKVD